MAVILRNAQHLCWKNFRKINDKLDPDACMHEENDLIYIEARGFATPTEDEGRSDLKETVACQTASEKYAW